MSSEAPMNGAALFRGRRSLQRGEEEMPEPDVRLFIERATIYVVVQTPGISVEVRNYDVGTPRKGPGRPWTDERGRTCMRYLVTAASDTATKTPILRNLERFVEDLKDHAGVDAEFRPDKSADGLHVLTINNADFYFCADGSGYDGWGKRVS